MMERLVVFDGGLTLADRHVLTQLVTDMERHGEKMEQGGEGRACDEVVGEKRSGREAAGLLGSPWADDERHGEAKQEQQQQQEEEEEERREAQDGGDNKEAEDREKTEESNDKNKTTTTTQEDPHEPVVFLSIDSCAASLPAWVNRFMVRPYVSWARTIVRHETDVVMVTHLLLYFTTLVPSAALLFRRFSYAHAAAHLVLALYYVGTYTLMMHQHIHQRGILAKRYALLDRLFPYITDPMMGHTWNTYFYHHVKHHHVEGNGPDDLSTTMRYQRDSLADFLRYVGRFYFLVWLDLPLYFLRKGHTAMAARALGSELASYAFYYLLARFVDARATVFVYLVPLMLLRAGLMVGNWGQHAFVDPEHPDSDYQSSITLVDVASNRFCFNDGYHTSHHLNPMRHWLDHPKSFLQQRHVYAKNGALVFHNIDFLMVTFRLMRKDYQHLAGCLVPMGDQIDLTMEGRVELLRKLTRKMSETEIRQRYAQSP